MGALAGGQAALFAAERATSYAPDLTLLGVAVAAPAADLNRLMTDDIEKISGVTIASYALVAYEPQYRDRYPPGSITAILTPGGAAVTPKLAALCLLSQSTQIHAIATPLIGRYVTANPAVTEPWKTLLEENSAGHAPITVPVFVGQGLGDKLVAPSATRSYVNELCASGRGCLAARVSRRDPRLCGLRVTALAASVAGTGEPRNTAGRHVSRGRGLGRERASRSGGEHVLRVRLADLVDLRQRHREAVALTGVLREEVLVVVLGVEPGPRAARSS